MYNSLELEYHLVRDLIKQSNMDSRWFHTGSYSLYSAIKNALMMKSRIKQIMGLGDDYRTEVVTMDPYLLRDNHTYSLFKLFVNCGHVPEIVKYSEATITNAIVTNQWIKGTQKIKLSKFLMREVKREVWADWVADKERIHADDQKNQSLRVWDNFVSALFEEARSMKRSVIVSANPLDFFLASEQCGFESCYAFDGAHANAIIAKLRDDFSFMAFAVDNAEEGYPYYKHGRMWCYLPDNAAGAPRLKLVLGKVYGNISEPQVRAISNHLTNRIAEHYGLESRWVGRSDFDVESKSYPVDHVEGAGHKKNTHEEFSVYFDLDISRYAYHKSLADTSPNPPMLSFNRSICLMCGCDTDHGGAFMCAACEGDKERCASCRDLEPRDDGRIHDDDFYCDTCFHQQFSSCRECCEYHRDDDMTLNESSERVCSDCIDEHYQQCEGCDDYIRNDSGLQYIEVSEQHLCDHCVMSSYTKCDDCDEYENDGDLETGHENGTSTTICRNCRDEKYVKCSDCGDYIHKTEFSRSESVCDGCSPEEVDALDVAVAAMGNLAELSSESAA